jgi:branched-chain amino acid transport system ATP-binding protein
MTYSEANSIPLLEVRALSIHFGGIVALDDVSFSVNRSQILGLIGPNGAGKTTLFNCLSHLYRAHSGDILIDGHSVMKTASHGMASLGIGRTFQNLALFSSMTVFDNIMVGGHCIGKSDFVSNALRMPWVIREETDLRRRASELISYLGLGEYSNTTVAGLPFGTQKTVELGRALMSSPRLLLLDEPAGGLNHEEVDALAGLIRNIRDQLKLTIVLVEHHMNLVMQVSDKVVTLDFGRKIAEGTPAEIQQNSEVIRAYLGTGRQ